MIATHGLDVPFAIDLGDGDVLACEKILRLLPGKRVVCLARCSSRMVVAKIFVDPVRAARHVKREVKGLRALRDAGIAAPDIVGQVTFGNGAVVLLTEYLEGAVSLSVLLKAAGDERGEVLERLFRLIAQCHKAGLAQDDLHLDNFLEKEGVIYCVDGAAVDHRSQGEPLGWEKSLRNLGLFFAQFSGDCDSIISEGWASYVRDRGEAVGIDWEQTLREAVAVQQRKRRGIVLGKIFRDCTDFVCEKDLSRFVVCDRGAYTPAMRGLLDDPDSAFESGEVLKKGGASTVARVVVDGRSVIVKRYNIKNWVKRLQRLVLRRRVRLAWRNVHLLRFLGIATAAPIAMVEKRWVGLPTVGYIVSEEVSGPDGRDLLRHCRAEGTSFESYVGLMADLLRQLARFRIGHGDLKATNMILADGRFVIIDLDGMRVYSERRYRRALRKDCLRLVKNWQDWPEMCDAVREKILPVLLKADPRGLVRCWEPQWQGDGLRVWPLGSQGGRFDEGELAGALAGGEVEVLKEDMRRFVFRWKAMGKSYVVKSFPLRRFKDKRRYMRYAASELRHNLCASELGISVPQCYGYFEGWRLGLVHNCGVVMEDLVGFQTLGSLLDDDGQALMAAIPVLIELYRKGVNHVDITPSNIFFRDDLSDYKIIDWQYCAFGPGGQDLQLVIQAAHFLRYAQVTSENKLWGRWLRELYDVSGCRVGWEEFCQAVTHLQGRKNTIGDRLYLRAVGLGIA